MQALARCGQYAPGSCMRAARCRQLAPGSCMGAARCRQLAPGSCMRAARCRAAAAGSTRSRAVRCRQHAPEQLHAGSTLQSSAALKQTPASAAQRSWGAGYANQKAGLLNRHAVAQCVQSGKLGANHIHISALVQPNTENTDTTANRQNPAGPPWQTPAGPPWQTPWQNPAGPPWQHPHNALVWGVRNPRPCGAPSWQVYTCAWTALPAEQQITLALPLAPQPALPGACLAGAAAD